MKRNLLASLALCLGLAVVYPVSAVDFDWNNPGVGDWNDGANWNSPGPGTVPNGGGGNFARIDNGGTANITGNVPQVQDYLIGSVGIGGTISQSAGTNSITGWLRLGVNAGSNGTYNMSGGSLAAGRIHIGEFGAATVNHSAGTLTAGGNEDTRIGVNGGGSGIYNLSGTGNLDTRDLLVGIDGTGVFNQNGSNVTLGHGGGGGWLFLGQNGGSNGTYNLNAGMLSVGEIVDGGGTGRLNIDGGTLNLTNVNAQVDLLSVGLNGNGSLNVVAGKNYIVNQQMQIGDNAGSTGLVTQTGGTVTVNSWLNVGRDGKGTYNISGGTLNANQDLNIADQVGGAGIDGMMTISGAADVNANNTYLGKNGGTGVDTQSGGTFDTAGDFFIGTGAGGSNGTFNISGGSAGAGSIRVGDTGVGIVNQTNGSVTSQNWVTIGEQAGSNGQYNISGGSLTSINQPIAVGLSGTGSLTQTGGTVLASGATDLFVGYNGGGVGTYNFSAGTLDTRDLRVGFNGTGTFNQTGGNIELGHGAGNGWLFLGQNGGSTGTYNLTGGMLTVGRIVDGGGVGIFNVDGGTLVATDAAGPIDVDIFRVGENANGAFTLDGNHVLTAFDHLVVGGLNTGTLTINSGSINTPGGSGLRLGTTGTGVGLIDMNGGAINSNAPVQIGDAAGSSGTIDQSAGVVTVNSFINVGHFGVGAYNISGGTLNANGDLNVADQNGPAAVDGTMLISGAADVNANIVYIGKNGSTGVITQTGGTFDSAGDFVLGTGDGTGVGTTGKGVGTLVVNSGTTTVGGVLQVGESANSEGTVTQSGGIVNANNHANIGHFGKGAYEISGGVFNVNTDLNVADQNGPAAVDGTMTISGMADVNTNKTFIGKNGSTGIITQSGGTFDTAGDFFIGSGGGNGTFNVSGGIANAGTMRVGDNGVGVVNQTGGSVTSNNWVVIGEQAGSNGSQYNISAGSLTSINQPIVVGLNGSAELNVSGGVVTTPEMNVAVNASGTVNHSGGTTNVANNMNVGTSSGTGVYNLNGTGLLSFGDTAPITQDPTGLPASTLTVGANGDFNFTGGTLENVTTIDVTSSPAGAFVQDGGRFVVGIDGGLDPNNPLTQRAMTTIVGGDFLQNAGTLAVDIFGLATRGAFAGEFEGNPDPGLNPIDGFLTDSDLLYVEEGTATLDGTLAVNLNGVGTLPWAWYDVVVADEIFITDGKLDISGVGIWRIIQDPTDPTRQILQVATPEPGGIELWCLLGGVGLLAYRWTARRRSA